MSIASWNLLGLTDAAGALSLIVKVTLVLGVAYVAAALLRSRTAAARHFVWLLALGSVLALPLLARTPRIAVETPYWPAVASAVPAARPALKAARGAFVSVNDIDVAVPARTPAAERPARAELARWIPVLWLAGLLFVLGWQALGHLGLWRLSRASSEVTDPRWQWILGHCARQVGVSRTVELRKSAAVGSPLLCGVFQPKVVLPVDAEEWAEDLRRAVALHELAHVARRDALAQRIAGVACAVFWFHPGVWLAARRMRAESERACDDRVLGLGFPAADYAAHLLDVMKSSRALRLSGAVAIGMANRSTLEGRLLALFEKRSRGVLTRRARIVAAGAFALLLFAVAGIRPVARASASGTPAAAPKSSDALALNREQEDEQEGTPYSGTFEMGPGGTLVLRLDAGAGIVVRGWDQRRVQIDGRVGGVDGRRVAVNMTREGDQVSLVVRPKIATSNHFSSSNHFEIHVPRRVDIELRSAGGDLTVEGVQGTIRGATSGGALPVWRVRGGAQLSTGGGEIHVSDSRT